MLNCLRRNEPKEVERILRSNDEVYNEQFQYAANDIKTSKYNIFTFLPKNLLEQSTRVANAYFLFLLFLQLLPFISSLTFVTTVIPLVVVLTVTAIKDLIDDIQRHRNDRKINNRKAHLVKNGKLEDTIWKNIKVGNMLKVNNNELIPADLILLTSSEPSGLAFIETADLDGESNLKNKVCVSPTVNMEDDLKALTEFDGDIVCDPPNNQLNNFHGRLALKGQRSALTRENILLRGCALKNTGWVIGVVVYAGSDTKLMMNGGVTRFKKTHIDRLMNKLIVKIVIFLLIICLVCCIGNGVWESHTGFHFQQFLSWPPFFPGQPIHSTELEISGGACVSALLTFLSYIILLNTLVPISLYVSVEIIRFTQSWWINWDDQMIHDDVIRARARTTALNEELGQIQVILSDKTGTLTENLMCFKKCSVDGKMYSEDAEDSENDCTARDLSERLKDRDGKVVEFFRIMATCHTVLSTIESDKLVYQAQSPDEAALVEASRKFGVIFQGRTHKSITISCLDGTEQYELLHILDFNNERKRMSVIVRREGVIKIFSKGADSKIIERLKPGCAKLLEITESHLNYFAGEGLRTLCLASREISIRELETWQDKLQEASTTLKNYEEMLDNVYDLIERDLDLLGVTAIEDKLQVGVAETIENLRLAGIKIWVLTGDKQETAVNIGFSCKLLTDDLSELFLIDGQNYVEVENQLNKIQTSIEEVEMVDKLSKIKTHTSSSRDQSMAGDGLIRGFVQTLLKLNVKVGQGNFETKDGDNNNVVDSSFIKKSYAIVVNGESLRYALSEKLLPQFITMGSKCSSVICCRVTPLQKAEVVEAVKDILKVITLAVGDGANDVSMIKSANIGVGINGQEGMQAVISSDYSIGRFRFLERLLLVHGRWSYIRMSKFLRFFFYKNFAFTFCQFWFAFYSGFSAQTIYDPSFVSMFNLIYTSLPIVALGIFDQDVSDKSSISYPQLYYPGPNNLFFGAKLFLFSAVEGIITSFVIYYVTMTTWHDQELSDLQSVGFVTSSTMVIVVSLRCSIETSYWTPFSHLVTWGSIVVFFLFHLILYLPSIGYSHSGVFFRLVSRVSFWSIILLSSVILLLPVVSFRLYQSITSSNLSDRIRQLQRKNTNLIYPRHPNAEYKNSFAGRGKEATDDPDSRVENKEGGSARPRTPSTALSRTSLRSSSRSSYAFSHDEGYGRMITSGNIFKKRRRRKVDTNE